MNKFKKLTIAAVAVVMAGSMAFGVVGCKTPEPDPDPVAGNLSLDENGRLTYSAGTVLNTYIGYQSAETGISFGTDQFSDSKLGAAEQVTLPNGSTYRAGDLKPAWAALESTLGVDIVDKYTDSDAVGDDLKSAGQVDYVIRKGIENYDIFTGSTQAIKDNSTRLLDLNKYLNYMPNYKAFLESSPAIRLSLTTNTTTGAMYMAPYFDGNDDIEKYVIARKDIIEKILDSDISTYTTTETFASQAAAKSLTGTAASVTAHMGNTDYEIETTDPSKITGANKSEVTDATATVKVKVMYSKALAAAKENGSDLNTALTAAYPGLNTATLTSGNIVDLMNAVINGTNGAVTGDKLVAILRAYIDVAYTDANGAAFYTTANGLNRSDVFNSAAAAWDVDLMVALYRCYVTNSAFASITKDGSAVNGLLYALSPREAKGSRRQDIVSFVGELYGVRGLESRYLYTYIDDNGAIQDSRMDPATWEALDKMNALVDEGLCYPLDSSHSAVKASSGSYYQNDTTVQTLMIHDYVQTQTANGGFAVQGIKLDANVPADYNFAPILTPVSKWDIDGDGEYTDIMRFTESWRSVKNTGFALAAHLEQTPEKLSAALKFVDYFFSNDGQILMTYGPQSTNGNVATANGFWYGTEASVTLDSAKAQGIVASYDGLQYYVTENYKAQYFAFGNKLYSGTFYNGRMIPTMTDNNLKGFYKQEVNGNTITGYALNYTGYARSVIGSALPIGNKDQGFEYQCTAQCGIIGADIVNIALNNGTIKHVTQGIDADSYWFTIAPSMLPYSTLVTQTIDRDMADLDDKLFAAESSSYNVGMDVISFGLGANVNLSAIASNPMPANAEDMVTLLSTTYKLSTYVGYMQSAWTNLLNWYNA